MARARKVLASLSLLTLYYSFIFPYLTHCKEVWGGAHERLLKGVIKLQKKALRIITGSKFRAHTDELFISTKIMDVHKL